MTKQRVSERCAELVGHQRFDRRPNFFALCVAFIFECHQHTCRVLVRGCGWFRNARYLAAQYQREFQFGDPQYELELRAERQWAFGGNERAAARDTLGVVGEKSIQPLVVHPQFHARTRADLVHPAKLALSSASG
jgi:hypothetical protein